MEVMVEDIVEVIVEVIVVTEGTGLVSVPDLVRTDSYRWQRRATSPPSSQLRTSSTHSAQSR